MKNFDQYLSTPDELFNRAAQSLYFQFTGSGKPDINQPLDVFLRVFHEAYFFIKDNQNKPFGCIENIKELTVKYSFEDQDKIFLVDTILALLSLNPDQDKMALVYIQFVDYRNDLFPYANDPEILNHKWTFDFESIKAEFNDVLLPSERRKFLMDLWLNFGSKNYEMDVSEHDYYESIGFQHWIKIELLRCDYDQKQETQSNTINFKPSTKQGARIDLIRILNALYELKLINKTDGQTPTKEFFMIQAGNFFGIDLSKYDTNLSQSLNETSLEANLKVFEDMIKNTTNAHYLGKNVK
jgi:hypothetical protein